MSMLNIQIHKNIVPSWRVGKKVKNSLVHGMYARGSQLKIYDVIMIIYNYLQIHEHVKRLSLSTKNGILPRANLKHLPLWKISHAC